MADPPEWLDRVTVALEAVVAPNGPRIKEWVAKRGPAFPAIRIYQELTFEDGRYFQGVALEPPISPDDLDLLEMVIDALQEEGQGNLTWRRRSGRPPKPPARPPWPFSDFLEYRPRGRLA